MKIAVPDYGKLGIPLAGLLQKLGLEFILSNGEEKRYLELGSQLAPQEWGWPLRIQLGSYMAALEAGAEMLLMTPGCGGCREDVNRQKQKDLLRQAGYEFQGVDLDFTLAGIFQALNKMNSGKNLWRWVAGMKHFWWSVRFLSDLEERRLALGSYMSDHEREEYQRILSELTYRVFREDLFELVWEAEALFEVLEGRQKESVAQGQSVVQVGLVGDVYSLTVVEPLLGVKDHLLSKGIAVQQPLRVDEWLKGQVWPMKRQKRSGDKLARLLDDDGDPLVWRQVGSLVQCSQNECAGVIQLVTCEHSAPAEEQMRQGAQELGLPLFRLHLHQEMDPGQLAIKINAFVSLLNVERKSVKNLNSMISI